MKKFLLSALALVAVAALAITGTIAYLQFEDEDVNVMTLGNVAIRQNEEQRVDPAKNGTLTDDDIEDFEQAKPLYPYVDENLNGALKDDYEEITFPNGKTHKLFIGDNAIDKLVSVTNTGKSEAYVRTIIALEAPTDKIDIAFNSTDWKMDKDASSHSIEVDGVKYDLFVCVYGNVLKPGETTPYSLLQVALGFNATNEDVAAYGDTYDVLVLSQAVQTEGFADAQTALDAAFGKVDSTTAAEWFDGVEIPVVAPADAVCVGGDATHETFADLFAGGKNIRLTESVAIANPESSRFTEFTVNGEVGIWCDEGVTITFAETTTLTGDGVLTVYSGSIDEKQELCVTEDVTLVFEGGEHSFSAFSATSNGTIIVNGGTLNCLGTYAGILGICFGENGKLIVNDGTLNMYQPFNLNPNRCDAAYVEINGGNIHLLNGADKLFAVRNIMDKDRLEGGVLRGSSIKITGGVFTTTYELDDTGDANAFIRNEDGNADTTRVLEFNSYNGEKQYDCAVTGGTFYGSWMRTGETEGDASTVCENTIAGFVADGYKIVGDETNGYVVSVK